MKGKDGGAAKVLRREWALRRLPRWGRGVRRRAAPLRTETAFQAVPVFRMAYSLQTAHCAVCRETLMLQVRCAHPTGNLAPTQLFELRRCCAWLILRFRTIVHADAGVPLGLFDKSKRSSFSRFAASRFRTDPPLVRRCSARLIRQAETLELQPLRGLHQATLWLDLQNAHSSGSLRSPCGYRGPKGNPSGAAGG